MIDYLNWHQRTALIFYNESRRDDLNPINEWKACLHNDCIFLIADPMSCLHYYQTHLVDWGTVLRNGGMSSYTWITLWDKKAHQFLTSYTETALQQSLESFLWSVLDILIIACPILITQMFSCLCPKFNDHFLLLYMILITFCCLHDY